MTEMVRQEVGRSGRGGEEGRVIKRGRWVSRNKIVGSSREGRMEGVEDRERDGERREIGV